MRGGRGRGLGRGKLAGLGVAGLGRGGDRAAFDEAEAQAGKTVQGLAILVETGGEADRVGQAQPRDLCRQNRIISAGRRQGDGFQRCDGEAVSGLRIEPAQDCGAEIGDRHQAGTVKGAASVTAFTGRGP